VVESDFYFFSLNSKRYVTTQTHVGIKKNNAESGAFLLYTLISTGQNFASLYVVLCQHHETQTPTSFLLSLDYFV
jgi:hypothetical protein